MSKVVLNKGDCLIQKLCECGCGEVVKKVSSTYKPGHNLRINNPMKLDENKKKVSQALTKHDKQPRNLCKCGCGEYAKSGRKYINKHWWNCNEYRNKNSKSSMGRKVSKITKEKMSISQAQAIIKGKKTNYNSGWFFSNKLNDKIHYRSSYELRVYNILEKVENVINYIVEPFRVPYKFNGIIKNTVPDILINYYDGNKELVEIKPTVFVETPIVLIKIKALWKYANKKGWSFNVWTEDYIEALEEVF